MIEINGLKKAFEKNVVFNGVSLKINKGEVLALIGKSGMGKSILLRHLAGFIRPDSGRIVIDEKEITSLRGRELMNLRRRMGFLFQSGALFDSMTVFDNVAFPLREKTRMTQAEVRKRVMDELDKVGLSGQEEKYPSQLSGGMRKRAALARLLVWEPEIMFFDEPTTGLDPIISNAILQLISAIHRNLGFTGIIVTHEIPGIFGIVDKVAMLHEGRIEIMGTPEEVVSSKSAAVDQFINGRIEGPISFR